MLRTATMAASAYAGNGVSPYSDSCMPVRVTEVSQGRYVVVHCCHAVSCSCDVQVVHRVFPWLLADHFESNNDILAFATSIAAEVLTGDQYMTWLTVADDLHRANSLADLTLNDALKLTALAVAAVLNDPAPADAMNTDNVENICAYLDATHHIADFLHPERWQRSA